MFRNQMLVVTRYELMPRLLSVWGQHSLYVRVQLQVVFIEIIEQVIGTQDLVDKSYHDCDQSSYHNQQEPLLLL